MTHECGQFMVFCTNGRTYKVEHNSVLVGSEVVHHSVPEPIVLVDTRVAAIYVGDGRFLWKLHSNDTRPNPRASQFTALTVYGPWLLDRQEECSNPHSRHFVLNDQPSVRCILTQTCDEGGES